MQPTTYRRLITPTQAPPSSSSPPPSLYGPRFGYSQPLVALPAAYGYLPRQRWPQEHASLSGGPRAVPLRMQRAAMNSTDQHPMPIPSLQLSSDRPYSVPNRPNQLVNRENSSNYTHPPRPASSSMLDDFHYSVSTRSSTLSQYREAQETETDLPTTDSVVLDNSALPVKSSNSTRRVAKRGSRTKLPNKNNLEELSSTISPFDHGVDIPIGGQKRVNENTTLGPNSSKRIKINVFRGQSQAVTSETSKSSLLANPKVQEPQSNKTNHMKTPTTEDRPTTFLGEFDDNTTQSSDSEDGLNEDLLTSKKREQADSTRKLDPYDNTATVSLNHGAPNAKSQANTGDIDHSQGTEVSDISRGSGRTLDKLNIDNRNATSRYYRYADASSQCNTPSEDVSGVAQTKFEEKLKCYSQLKTNSKGASNAQDMAQGNPNNEDLHSRFSRIDKMINVQKENGMDEFIKRRLNTGDPDVLETLTSEILIGLVARDGELFEHLFKIV
ncbi:uncharacterized protein F4822DRAFT_300560 [Hypoxylon trugodes]|uniref:uncharacterized protein n=1 Tax=Hypoxylon trugodes TaxID=326681 RepID=UPI0021922B82|nr:uncharacterized protein F4822DRAFT_300560 [Hypoxylon trugodes]KAI1388028.1 hypothetical protein F4822DRAFT_300560 [Hypoxylon trugodes]